MESFNKMRKKSPVPKILNLIYPPVCGFCGKLNQDFICPKCRKLLEKEAIFGVDNYIKINEAKTKFKEKNYILETLQNKNENLNIINNQNKIEKQINNNLNNKKENRKKNTKKNTKKNEIPVQEYIAKYFDEHLYIFLYQGIIRRMILDYKFNEEAYLYKTFVNFLLKNKNFFEKLEKYDTIIPVPISNKRLKSRGYNQSLLLAKEISRNTSFNLKLQEDCLFKVKDIIEQSKLNKEERAKNIQGVYKLFNEESLYNKKILLVDDIFTTGSTVNECSKILRKANPKTIGIFTIAKDELE